MDCVSPDSASTAKLARHSASPSLLSAGKQPCYTGSGYDECDAENLSTPVSSHSFPKARHLSRAKSSNRSATSVGANWRAARRGRSSADMRSKLNIAVEEADESVYWLELLMEANVVPADRLRPLHREAEELTKILSAALLNAKRNNTPSPGPKPR